MIGFVIGTLCLFALARAVRRSRRHWGYYGYGYAPAFGASYGASYGPSYDRSYGYEPAQYDGYGPSYARSNAPFWLRPLFYRLGATPGQERVITEALAEARRAARNEPLTALSHARDATAQAIRGESFDETAMGAALAHQDEAVSAARKVVMDALVKVHAALDPRQREILADMIARGGWRSFAPFTA